VVVAPVVAVVAVDPSLVVGDVSVVGVVVVVVVVVVAGAGSVGGGHGSVSVCGDASVETAVTVVVVAGAGAPCCTRVGALEVRGRCCSVPGVV
jgi:hypothetical protein